MSNYETIYESLKKRAESYKKWNLFNSLDDIDLHRRMLYSDYVTIDNLFEWNIVNEQEYHSLELLLDMRTLVLNQREKEYFEG